MRLNTYRLTLQHDRGRLTLKVAAQSPEIAAEIVMKAEHCPRRAIKRIVQAPDLITRKLKAEALLYYASIAGDIEGQDKAHRALMKIQKLQRKQ